MCREYNLCYMTVSKEKEESFFKTKRRQIKKKFNKIIVCKDAFNLDLSDT